MTATDEHLASLDLTPELIRQIRLEAWLKGRQQARQMSKGMADYVDDPLGFIREYVKFPGAQRLAPYQSEIITLIPGKRRVAVRGPRGLGKSTTAALTILWFALTRDAAGIDWKVMTTAGSWAQLKSYLWPEIRKWARRVDWKAAGRPPLSPRTELLNTELHLTYGNVSAASPKDSAKLEGLHADHILVVYDEAKIVPAAMFDSAEGSFSAVGDDSDDEGLQAYALAISSPGEPSGRFYDLCRKAPGLDDWHSRHVTLDEAIKARRMTRKWAEQRKKLWGESSALYQNHVLGEFCASDEDAIIPLRRVEEAIARWRAWDQDGRPDPDGQHVIGVDVARSGVDKTILAHRAGPVITKLTEQSKADTMVTAGVVKVALDADAEARAVVDIIGVGAGVYDRLKEQDAKVEAFVSSHKTGRKDKTGLQGFANLRACAWWSLRELLDDDDCQICLPPDDELLGDLTSVHHKNTSTGAILIESKEDLKKRIGRSTDKGDAVVMALFTAGGSFLDTYGVTRCPNDACPRGSFLASENGVVRDRCPWCGTSLDEQEPAAAVPPPPGALLGAVPQLAALVRRR